MLRGSLVQQQLFEEIFGSRILAGSAEDKDVKSIIVDPTRLAKLKEIVQHRLEVEVQHAIEFLDDNFESFKSLSESSRQGKESMHALAESLQNVSSATRSESAPYANLQKSIAEYQHTEEQLRIQNVIVDLLQTLRKCSTQLQKLDTELAYFDYFSATETFLQLDSLVRDAMDRYRKEERDRFITETETFNLLKAGTKQRRTLLTAGLTKLFHQVVLVSENKIVVAQQQQQQLPLLWAAVESLGIQDAIISSLSESIYKFLLLPLFKHSGMQAPIAKQTEETLPPNNQIVWTLQLDYSVGMDLVGEEQKSKATLDRIERFFASVEACFSFVGEHIFGENKYRMRRFGDERWSSFCDDFIKYSPLFPPSKVPSPIAATTSPSRSQRWSQIVPDATSSLHDFEFDQIHFDTIVQKTKQFETDLVEWGFLPENPSRSLCDYVSDIQLHYTKLKKERIMAWARELISKEYHEQDAQEQEDLSKCPGIYYLPRCRVTVMAKSLVEKAKSTLKEASQTSSPQCAFYLYEAARSMFDLFRVIMPHAHAQSLETLPLASMLFFNDCMYISHHLATTLSVTSALRTSLSSPQGSNATMADLSKPIRDMGEYYFALQLEKQRDALAEALEEAGDFSDAENEKKFKTLEMCFKKITHNLQRLVRLWENTLPDTVYYRCMGSLLDPILNEIIDGVVALDDIGVEETNNIITLLSSLVPTIDRIFTPIMPSTQDNTNKTTVMDQDGEHEHGGIPKSLAPRYMSRWNKYTSLIAVLDMKLVDIVARYLDGTLPGLSSAELTKLVKALFADTPLRVKALKSIATNTSHM